MTPSLSDTERRLIDALAEIGVDATRAELPGPETASLYGGPDAPSDWYLTAAPADDVDFPRRQPAVSNVNGVTLWQVDEDADRPRYTFDCGRLTLLIGPEPPPSYTDVASFFEDLAAQMRCS